MNRIARILTGLGLTVATLFLITTSEQCRIRLSLTLFLRELSAATCSQTRRRGALGLLLTWPANLVAVGRVLAGAPTILTARRASARAEERGHQSKRPLSCGAALFHPLRQESLRLRPAAEQAAGSEYRT